MAVYHDPLGIELGHRFALAVRSKSPQDCAPYIRQTFKPGQLEELLSWGHVEARRAAAFGLGLTADYRSAAVIATGVIDSDAEVRRLAQEASWNIWKRAGTADEQARLELASRKIARNELTAAIFDLTILIAQAPNYAEAYNQRAIALFQLQRFAESAEDCRRALELNPYHFGAAVGMAQCFMRMNRVEPAYEAFLITERLNPFLPGIQEQVEVLRQEVQAAKAAKK
jgi:tetratricopeptide (TPR) repeat protein